MVLPLSPSSPSVSERLQRPQDRFGNYIAQRVIECCQGTEAGCHWSLDSSRCPMGWLGLSFLPIRKAAC